MQNQGSLAQTSLSSLLGQMQAERATGTLSVNSADRSCSLYFLFGHLFHAAGDYGQGEEAVITALAWPDGSFTFDPRAKLPAEETIKAATEDLLAESQRRQLAAPVNGGPARAGDHPGFPRPGPSPMTAAPPLPPPVPAAPPPVIPQPPPVPDYRTPPITTRAPAAPPEPPPAPPAWSAREQPLPAREQPLPAPDPRTSSLYGPVPSVAPPRTPAAVSGNPDAAPLGDMYPLPSGKPVYEGLKSAFVDFSKLLRTLDTDKHTGYVRLDGPDFAGVLLLHDGHVLEALFGDGQLRQGESAFQQLRLRMERGEGLLDVIQLGGETVVALAQLLTARPMFTGLLGRFVNFEGLLEYLAEERVDGSIVVAGDREAGIILLRKGAVHGSYTQSRRDLLSDPGAVTVISREQNARIEVKAGSSSPIGINVESALRKPL